MEGENRKWNNIVILSISEESHCRLDCRERDSSVVPPSEWRIVFISYHLFHAKTRIPTGENPKKKKTDALEEICEGDL